MIEREFAVMSALQGSGVPAPRMIAICEDETLIGAAFYVMEMVEGRVFWDPRLPEVSAAQRRQIFAAMNETVARLHAVEPNAVGLGAFGRPQNFMSRQVERWTQQYRATETHRIEDMEKLIAWLPHNLPAEVEGAVIFHGDLRLDNMIFHPSEPRVVALLDWELSTLGDPLADFAYHMMTWRIPPDLFRGLGGVNLTALGIPSEEEYFDAYVARTGRRAGDSWPFYLAFSFFRLAAILQGVARRALDGNASAANASELGARAAPLSALGWSIAQGGS